MVLVPEVQVLQGFVEGADLEEHLVQQWTSDRQVTSDNKGAQLPEGVTSETTLAFWKEPVLIALELDHRTPSSSSWSWQNEFIIGNADPAGSSQEPDPAQQTDGTDVSWDSNRDRAGPASKYAWIPRNSFKTDQLVVEALFVNAKDQRANIPRHTTHNEFEIINDGNGDNDDTVATAMRSTRTRLPVISELVNLAIDAIVPDALTKDQGVMDTTTVGFNGIIPNEVISYGGTIHAVLQRRSRLNKIELIALLQKEVCYKQSCRGRVTNYPFAGNALLSPVADRQLRTEAVSLQRECTGNQRYDGSMRIITLHGNVLPTQHSRGLTHFLIAAVDAAQHTEAISGW
jgi:hypothetical protein